MVERSTAGPLRRVNRVVPRNRPKVAGPRSVALKSRAPKALSVRAPKAPGVSTAFWLASLPTTAASIAINAIQHGSITKAMNRAIEAAADYRNWFERNANYFKLGDPKTVYSNDPWLLAMAAAEQYQASYKTDMILGIIDLIPGLNVLSGAAGMILAGLSMWGPTLISNIYREQIKERLRAQGYNVVEEYMPDLSKIYVKDIEDGKWEQGTGTQQTVENLEAYIKGTQKELEKQIEELKKEGYNINTVEDLIKWLKIQEDNLANASTSTVAVNQVNPAMLQLIRDQLAEIEKFKEAQVRQQSLQNQQNTPNLSNVSTGDVFNTPQGGMKMSDGVIVPDIRDQTGGTSFFNRTNGLSDLENNKEVRAAIMAEHDAMGFNGNWALSERWSRMIAAMIEEYVEVHKNDVYGKDLFGTEIKKGVMIAFRELMVKRKNIALPNRPLTKYEQALLSRMLDKNWDVLFNQGFDPVRDQQYYPEHVYLDDEIKSGRYSGTELDNLRKQQAEAKKKYDTVMASKPTQVQLLEAEIKRLEVLLASMPQNVFNAPITAQISSELARKKNELANHPDVLAPQAAKAEQDRLNNLMNVMFPGNQYEPFGSQIASASNNAGQASVAGASAGGVTVSG